MVKKSCLFLLFIPIFVLFSNTPALVCEKNICSTPLSQATETPKPPFIAMAPVANQITYDINWSPYAGGEDLLFAHRLLEKFETYMLSSSSISYAKTAYARFWRLSELISIWLPLNYLAMVVQHEVFGHGYRIRDLNDHNLAIVNKYSFKAPPPYDSGGASTSYFVSSRIATSEEGAIAIGGVEATAILAQITKMKWLESGRIDPRQSVLYLLSQQDLTFYIDSLDLEGNSDGHDIQGYIKMLNFTYPDSFLSTKTLRNLSWINLADPFTFYAIFSWFHYLSSGKETKIPMIASMYLPGFRLGLTPFGPEIFFENYFIRNKTPIYAYLKAGNHAKNTYWGAGVYAPQLWSVWKWSFGLRGDFWHQPKLLLEPGSTPFFEIDFDETPSTENPLYTSVQRHTLQFGGAASLVATYQAAEKCGYEMEFGTKSKGFLPGYSLWAFPTVRLSFNLVF